MARPLAAAADHSTSTVVLVNAVAFGAPGTPGGASSVVKATGGEYGARPSELPAAYEKL